MKYFTIMLCALMMVSFAANAGEVQEPTALEADDDTAPAADALPLEGLTVSTLHGLCDKKAEADEINQCLNTLGAVMDRIRAAEVEKNSRVVCNSKPLNNYQARKIFAAWADAHPEFAEMAATDAVETALSAAHPCVPGNVIRRDPNKGIRLPSPPKAN